MVLTEKFDIYLKPINNKYYILYEYYKAPIYHKLNMLQNIDEFGHLGSSLAPLGGS